MIISKIIAILWYVYGAIRLVSCFLEPTGLGSDEFLIGIMALLLGGYNWKDYKRGE